MVSAPDWDDLWVYDPGDGTRTARRVPALLDMLARPRLAPGIRREAWGTLEACLEHQGGLSPAAIHVVPRLVAQLREGLGPRWLRTDLLRVLHLLAVPQPGNLYPDLIDATTDYLAIDPRCFHATSDRDVARACFEAVEAGVGALLPLVADRDPDVACATIVLASEFRRHTTRTRSALWACYTRACHPEVLACALLADARLGRDAPGRPIVVAEYLDAPQPAVRFAAACILAAAAGDEQRRAITELGAIPARGIARLGWFGPGERGLALISLRTVAGHEVAVVDSLSRLLEASPGDEQILHELLLRAARPGPHARHDHHVSRIGHDPQQLSAAQAAALEAICAHAELDDWRMRAAGLPPTRRAFQAWLGAHAPAARRARRSRRRRPA